MSRIFTEKEIFDFYSIHNISVKDNEKKFSRGSIVNPNLKKIEWLTDSSKFYRSNITNNSSQNVFVRGNHGQLEPNA